MTQARFLPGLGVPGSAPSGSSPAPGRPLTQREELGRFPFFGPLSPRPDRSGRSHENWPPSSPMGPLTLLSEGPPGRRARSGGRCLGPDRDVTWSQVAPPERSPAPAEQGCQRPARHPTVATWALLALAGNKAASGKHRHPPGIGWTMVCQRVSRGSPGGRGLRPHSGSSQSMGLLSTPRFLLPPPECPHRWLMCWEVARRAKNREGDSLFEAHTANPRPWAKDQPTEQVVRASHSAPAVGAQPSSRGPRLPQRELW